MIKGMRVVVAYTHLPKLRDMPMTAKYCATASAYSGNCGSECAIGKTSSQCAYTEDGTAWRAFPWALRARLRSRGSRRGGRAWQFLHCLAVGLDGGGCSMWDRAL